MASEAARNRVLISPISDWESKEVPIGKTLVRRFNLRVPGDRPVPNSDRGPSTFRAFSARGVRSWIIRSGGYISGVTFPAVCGPMC